MVKAKKDDPPLTAEEFAKLSHSDFDFEARAVLGNSRYESLKGQKTISEIIEIMFPAEKTN